ncbi:MAG TPA: hydroxysqualene dehydroxylase HpnE [Bacteroidota bacterium]|nr:hydroxysqualene dehydroxylase HpnE [Bacteroidota bacterium]
MTYDAVIIGGGLSGLAAAVKISAGGGRVALFEQSPKLGGRCYSYRDATTGETVDNGQHVLLGSYRALLHYLGVIGTSHRLRAEPSLTLPFHHPDRGFATLRMASLPAPLDLTAGILKYRFLSVREKADLLRAGKWLSSWTPAKAKSIESLTVDEWLTMMGQDRNSRHCFWDPISVSVMNERPDAASALLFARAMRRTFLEKNADSRMLIPTVGQTELYVRGAVRFLESRGSLVRLKTPVDGIALTGRGTDGVYLRDGGLVGGGSVISSVPPWALAAILPADGATAPILAAARTITPSPIVSINLWFDRAFMEGEVLGTIGRTVQWVFNRRAILGEGGGKGGCVSCVISAARDVMAVSPASLAELAAGELRSVFPGAARAGLVHAVVIKEKRATFSPTPAAEASRPAAASPVRGLFLAGDWTDTGLPATIEGAVVSGYAAADLVLNR